MKEPEGPGRGPGAGGDVRRLMERRLVGMWNELRVLATAARAELGVDPVLLHIPVLSDEPYGATISPASSIAAGPLIAREERAVSRASVDPGQ